MNKEDSIIVIFMVCPFSLFSRQIRVLAPLLYTVSKPLIGLSQVFLIWCISRLNTNTKKTRQAFTQRITFESIPDAGFFF